METLKNNTTKKIELLIKEFEDKTINFESNLLNELRSFAKEEYFLPFLEDFVKQTCLSKKIINSKYILQLLIKEETRLFYRDSLGICGNSYSFEEKEIIMLNEKYDLFIIKGVIVNLIENLNLTETLSYIKNELIKKYPKGSPDGKIIKIFNLVSAKKILELIENDFKKKNMEKLFLIYNE